MNFASLTEHNKSVWYGILVSLTQFYQGNKHLEQDETVFCSFAGISLQAVIISFSRSSVLFKLPTYFIGSLVILNTGVSFAMHVSFEKVFLKEEGWTYKPLRATEKYDILRVHSTNRTHWGKWFLHGLLQTKHNGLLYCRIGKRIKCNLNGLKWYFYTFRGADNYNCTSNHDHPLEGFKHNIKTKTIGIYFVLKALLHN